MRCHRACITSSVQKSKLFDFNNTRLRGNITTIDKLSHADVEQQYAAFIAVADEEMWFTHFQRKAILCPEEAETFSSSDFYGTSKLCSKCWACFQHATRTFATQQSLCSQAGIREAVYSTLMYLGLIS